MIADAIEVLIDKPGFKADVYPVSKNEFEVGSEDINALIALLVSRK
jgi:hypothetical protein